MRVGSAKHQRLLAVLLLHVNERVDRDRIIDLVWAGDPPRSALNLLQKYVGELRRSFGDEGPELAPLAGGYRLRLSTGQLDSARFGELVETARSQFADGELVAAQACLREALALWRGPAYDGFDAEAADTERARLDELRIAALEDLAEITLARGQHDAAAADLARLTKTYPFRERLRELQMIALYRQGRRAEALAVFDTVRTVLADELGIDPGARLRRCYELILRGDPELEPGSEPVEATAAPLPVRQLPLPVLDFVGRVEQVAEVTTALVARTPSVVAVAGGPGVGKSSLVVRAAHLVSESFPDGQLYFDLAATSDTPQQPAQLLADALRALSVAGNAIPPRLTERAALYRSLLADRRMLVVLEDAGAAEQVLPLLPAAGGCAVLITSRALLTELPGARQIDLDVLDHAEAYELFTGIVGGERVAAEPGEAAAILDSCGNLPLAIRIAGARLAGRPAWSLRVLRERLADESRRLTELRIGQLGVRASVELSMRLLPPDAARALSLLGLLGAHTLPGWVVGALLDRPDAEAVLDTLVDASLLRLTTTDAIGQPRYRLHDLIRAYARESVDRIPYPERRDAIARVLGGWLSLAEHATDLMPAGLLSLAPGTALRWTPPETPRLVADPFAWFDAERDTLLGAVRLAADWGLDEPAWELAASAVTYYDHRCLHEDWKLGHHIALEAVRAANNLRGESVLLRALGQVHIYRDDFDDAVRDIEAARALCQLTGDKLGGALALSMLGTVSREQGRHDEALSQVRQALLIVVGERDRHLEAQLRSSIASMLLARGELDEAAEWFEEALRLARALGDRHRIAVVLRRMSSLHDQRGNPGAALACLAQALDAFVELSDERCAGYTLLEIGRVHARRHSRQVATEALESAAGVFHRHGDRRDEAECWRLLADLNAALDQPGAARRHYDRALRLWRTIGDTARIAAAMLSLGALSTGRPG
ncbi:BTAD domain-containing putative transcriptional regulator [Kutzneria buriramensis]|uniref:AfsR/SARP family transcriptional regulator n=1 Tax=Kutzneria buriramensis TaxID=1045776 RepID=UPI0014778315|nr:BTAD domain-containing putative transcriptional regulator [Kutzneria buriramensis]